MDKAYREWFKHMIMDQTAVRNPYQLGMDPAAVNNEPKDPRLNWDELQETICQIIETFEDFLNDRGITIDNPEKNDSTGNPKSNIYGTDYGELQSNLELIFVDRGLVTQEIIDKFK
jgi:hypothetical protein